MSGQRSSAHSGTRPDAPRAPRILLRRHARSFVPKTLQDFSAQLLAGQTFTGVLLLGASLMALLWINSPWRDSYTSLWTARVSLDLNLLRLDEDVRYVVNEGLLTLFFFVAGLEIKRELRHGQLRRLENAALPIIAAAGGMALPALIYTAFNAGSDGARGWGVPMATDVPFAIAALSLLGRRIPSAARVFLLGLAVSDDLGSIVIIALFYPQGFSAGYFAAAVVVVLAVIALNSRGVRSAAWYGALGVLTWLLLEHSGVEPAILGALLGLLTPALPFYAPQSVPSTVRELALSLTPEKVDEGGRESVLSQIEDAAAGGQAPLDRLERAMLPWVDYIVLPLFCLANAGVELSGHDLSVAGHSRVLAGILLGRLLGKPLGITLFSFVACRTGLCRLADGLTWRLILGVGIAGGIGFTVSLFIAQEAYPSRVLLTDAKIAILCTSLLSGAIAYAWLRFVAARN